MANNKPQNGVAASSSRADEETPLLKDQPKQQDGDDVQQETSEETIIPDEMSTKRLVITLGSVYVRSNFPVPTSEVYIPYPSLQRPKHNPPPFLLSLNPMLKLTLPLGRRLPRRPRQHHNRHPLRPHLHLLLLPLPPLLARLRLPHRQRRLPAPLRPPHRHFLPPHRPCPLQPALRRREPPLRARPLRMEHDRRPRHLGHGRGRAHGHRDVRGFGSGAVEEERAGAGDREYLFWDGGGVGGVVWGVGE